MAIVRAVKTGVWSDVTVWNTGALPTSADDVYSNTFTVTIDTSSTVLSINNAATTGVTAGGTFAFTSSSNGCTLTCTALSGLTQGNTTSVVTSTIPSPSSATLAANIVGTLAGFGSTYIVSHSGTGTLTINGNITGAGFNSGGLQQKCLSSSNGTVNINGNITTLSASSSNSPGCVDITGGIANTVGTITGSAGSLTNYHAITVSGSATLNHTGNVTGITGSGISSSSSTATVNITGACTSTGAANAVVNSAAGTINITGTATGGSSTGSAFANNSTGTITHVGTAQASATAAAIGAGAAGQITILTGPLLSTDASYTGAASSGVNPCIALRWFPADTALGTFEYRMRGQTVAGSPSARPARSLYLTNAYDASYPATSNVRSGTTYGAGGSLTGTCAVPAAASVVVGVPVDNTTGTAAVTAASIRAAVGLASANLDTQLAPLPNLDTTVSSRLASASYQAPLDAAGTRSAIGLATANLDTQFDNIPTANENALAVETQLSLPLANLDAAVSTRSTFDPTTDTVAQVTLVDTTTNLTNPPDVPTTSEIATAVAAELDPTLSEIDTNVLSRLAAVDYTTPPTAEENALAVREELSPELDRVQNCATVATTGQQIQDALSS